MENMAETMTIVEEEEEQGVVCGQTFSLWNEIHQFWKICLC